MNHLIEDFISLIYPRTCAGCNQVLNKFEKGICLNCQADLPKTNFHKFRGNPVEKILAGRVNYSWATAFLFFEKDAKIQSMIHALKYKGNALIGKKLGQFMGEELRSSALVNDLEMIIPIPLHSKKLAIRGYNQAAVIAEGLSEGMQVPYSEKYLIRSKFTDTQTRKNRFERFTNMQEVFGIGDNTLLSPTAHVLLVDDVITTGATIESCANLLQHRAKHKVSVGVLAMAIT